MLKYMEKIQINIDIEIIKDRLKEIQEYIKANEIAIKYLKQFPNHKIEDIEEFLHNCKKLVLLDIKVRTVIGIWEGWFDGIDNEETSEDYIRYFNQCKAFWEGYELAMDELLDGDFKI